MRLLLDLVDVRLRVHNPEAELLLLRHQLRVVRRQVKTVRLTAADRTVVAALSQRVSREALSGILVGPETVMGWHRQLVSRKWAAFGRRRGPGRPGLDPELQKVILQMAKDNPRWGCIRVRGELLKLGHVVSATAIRRLLRRHRIGPAPLRSRQTWKAFLRAQASAIVLTDFLTVDTQSSAQGREDETVRGQQFWWLDLPAEDYDLVAESEEFEVALSVRLSTEDSESDQLTHQ